MSEQLVQLIADMEEEQALALIKQMLDQGADPVAILDDCRAAMSVVGQRFEAGEYFIPELILAGEILKSISAEVKPRMQQAAGAKQGAKVLLGTVKGDIHDIGKDIVNFMLDVNGFQVTDLGVDVPIETFVETDQGTATARRGAVRIPDAGLHVDERNGGCHRRGRSARQGEDHGRRRHDRSAGVRLRQSRCLRQGCDGGRGAGEAVDRRQLT